MATESKSSKPTSEITYRRLNLKGLIILGVILFVAVASFFPIKIISDRATRRSALAQAQASEKAGNIDLALRNMDRYVTAWPDDLPGLKFHAKLLAQSPQSIPQLLNAAQANERVLRLDPNDPESQEVRRRIAKLHIQYSDARRRYATVNKEFGSETSELRYRAAVNTARQLIEHGANDAEAHQLLAMALEGMISPGDSKTLDESISEYRKAIELDPADTMAPERLAALQMTEKKDPGAAEATLDALLQANPKSMPARLARYRFYVRRREPAKSLAEMNAASELAPHDLAVQADAALDAIQRLDFAGARKHIDAIPATEANELQIRNLRGSLELSEQHPDQAVEEWRKGLMAAGGTNADLTWRLAYTLIELGRLNEARPLVSQYQRLAGDTGETNSRFLRALYEQRGGHPASAIRDLNRIVDQIGVAYKPDLYLTLGRCHEALGEQDEAMNAYQKAADLVPASPVPRREVARLLGNQNPEDAIKEMERALAQNPEDPALLVEVGRMRFNRQASLAEDQRRWDAVNVVLDHALQVAPADAAVLTLKADTLAANGQLDQAAGMLRKALDGPSKKKVEVWVAYAGALDRLGRRDEALKALEQASAPEAAGDHAAFRTARAKVLTRLNRAQAARDILSENRDAIPKSERPELARALAELCRELGDREGARAAMADWAKQLPEKAEPGLALLSFAQTYNDDEAARLGLEALRTVGGDVEPYGLAARALELLRVERPRSEVSGPTAVTDPAETKRLNEADRLVTQLKTEASQLAVVPMLEGMIFERRGQIPEAIEAYRRSLKDGSLSPALARLIELLGRQNKFAEIDLLKTKYANPTGKTNSASLMSSFNQIDAAVALKLNDNERAEKAVAEMVAAQPDSLTARATQARLLNQIGKPREAEATIRTLANRRPEEPAPWLALIAFRMQTPSLGTTNAAIDEVRKGYKGPHPELLLARCLWTTNDIPAATKKYEEALAQNGDDLTTFRDVAEFDEANQRSDEAEKVLRRAIKLDPKATWASRALALILTSHPEKANWEEAWALIKPGAPGAGDAPEDRLIRATVMARSPESSRRAEAVPAMLSLANDLPASNVVAIEARVRLAQAFLEARQVADAAKIIAPVADDLERTNASALAISIEALARSGDLSKAQKHLDRLVELEPNSPRTAASKAWVLQKTGKPDQAFDVIEAAYTEAENAPTGEMVALAFQDLLVKLGNPEGALKLAERIARKWPRNAYILARAQLPNGKTAEALLSCQIALEAGETEQALQVATTIAVEHRDNLEIMRGIDELATAALARDAKSPDVLNMIATLRHLQGRYEEEVDMYRLALDNNPIKFVFLNNMAWTLSEGLQRYDEALEKIDEAIRREGKAPEFLDTRGVILTRLGRLSEAATDLETSAQTIPKALTYFHLARVYRESKQMEDYRRTRDKAKELKLDIGSLDPTDKADVSKVMSGS